MLTSALTRKGAVEIRMILGDIMNSLYRLPVTLTAPGGDATQIITAASLAAGDVFIKATTGAHDVTLPTAEEIINAVRGNLNKISPQGEQLYVTQPAVQTQWPAMLEPLMTPISFSRLLYNVNAGGADTLVVQAASGVSLTDLFGVAGGAVALATLTWNEIEIIINNATPTLIAAGATTAAAKTLTLANPALAASITPGMSAYLASDTGWDNAGTKVTKVDLDNGVITMLDAAANTASLVAVTLTPTVIIVPKRSGTIVAAHG